MTSGIVHGSITNERNEALEGAIAELRNNTDSTVIVTSITDSMGFYEMNNIPFGKYFLLITYIGYNDYVSDTFVINKDDNTISLLPVTLKLTSNEIQSVNIVGRKSFIERRTDRTVVNVDALISNEGSNALEVLKKSPGITVDENGTISLKGHSGVMVFIDDKPTYLSPKDLADYLQSLPASTLNTIEIMPNPPARYDASGNAGALNIRLKKLTNKGFNGIINLSYKQGRYAQFNNSLNINYNYAKVNIFAGLTYNNISSYQDLILKRNYFDASGNHTSAFNQHSYIPEKSNGPKLRLGLDYYINNKSTWGFSISGFRWYSNSTTNNIAQIIDSNMAVANDVNAVATATSPFYNLTMNTNYNYKIDSSGKELSFNIDYLYYYNDLNNKLLNTVYMPDRSVLNQSNLLGHLQSSIYILTTNGDYTTPFLKIGKLDAGYKLSFISTKNVADFFDEVKGNLQPNTTFSNNFNYNENINAAYLNYNFEKKHLGIQAGLRYENTTIQGHQIGDANRADSSFKRVFNSFFPTFYLNYRIDTNSIHQLNFSYGRRIDRPNYQDMNPFTYPLDRYTLYGGNPYLLPTFSNNFELSYTYNNKYTITANYSIVKDIISETIDQQNGIFYSRPGNIGHSKSYGLTANATFNPIKKWTVNLYTDVIYNDFSAVLYGRPFTNKGATWSANITNQFTITNNWTAEISGFYNTNLYYAQFELIPVGMINIALAHKILKNRATIKLSGSDIFKTNKPGGNIVGLNNSTAQWRNKLDSRTITLAFSYSMNKGKTRSERKSSSADNERNRVNQ